MRKDGFNLIELIMAALLGGIVIVGITYGFRSLQKTRNTASTKQQTHYPLMQAGELIEKVGRVSRQCQKVITVAPD